ncbi:MAG TPA: hypothetical protein VMX57_03605, partial [Planctomycetota bacterium]|nr:hypothetical protein [Planctomycetota bacterium]
VMSAAVPVAAIERKPIEQVSIETLTRETQVSAPAGTSHVNMVWWIPIEFWELSLISDPNVTPKDRREFVNTLKPFAIVAVFQADVSNFGAFRFYSSREVEQKLRITCQPRDGAPVRLIPLQKIDPDVQMLLDVIKPILTAAAGNMGKNFHFYVLADRDGTGKRRIDPYAFGALHFQLGTREDRVIETKIELPLDSLYIPRKCPNGKDAHVSWQYCPWTGKKLPE